MTDAESTVVEETPETITIKDRRKEIENPLKRPFFILVVVLSLSLVAQGIATGLVWFVADDTNAIVNDVNFRNSPENQKAQQIYLEEIILRVDCNSRKAIEEALNEIKAENNGLNFDINITTERCSETDEADPG
jgi:hypothetical protein